jgi:hypothetical protein
MKDISEVQWQWDSVDGTELTLPRELYRARNFISFYYTLL